MHQARPPGRPAVPRRTPPPNSSNSLKKPPELHRVAAQWDSVVPPKPADGQPAVAKPEQQPQQVAKSPAPRIAPKANDANQIIIEALQAKAKPSATQPAADGEQPKSSEATDNAAGQRRWLATAKQFAARHQGLVLEAKPFPAGELNVPGGFDPCCGRSAVLVPWRRTVGNQYRRLSVRAWLRTGRAGLAAGIATACRRLGLASAAVELRHHGNDLRPAVGTPKSSGPEAIAEKRNEIARLQNKRDASSTTLAKRQVGAAGDSAETEEKKAAIREAMRAILEAPCSCLCSLPPSGPRKGESPAAAAVKPAPQSEPVLTARDQILYKVETLAANEISKLDERVRQLQTECNAVLAQSHGTNDLAVEQFEQACQKITVVIYKSVKALPESAEAAPSDARSQQHPRRSMLTHPHAWKWKPKRLPS